MATKAVGYIRVSTDSQAIDGVSLDAQRAKIELWCAANDLELVAVYADAGISGSRADNRPELQAALDAVCDLGGALVVYSLSRLARSTRDTLTIADRLQAADADLVSLTEKIDTTSAAGRMLFRLLAVLSEFEKDLVSERTKTALQHKKSKGERVGQIPYGFTLAGDGVSLVKDAGEQEALTVIQSLRTEGATLRTIASELTRRGIPTKNGGASWSYASVRVILQRVA